MKQRISPPPLALAPPASELKPLLLSAQRQRIALQRLVADIRIAERANDEHAVVALVRAAEALVRARHREAA
jgi:hypothetical protein